MPFSGKLQIETKPIPMKWQAQKPNTKPIFICAEKNTNIKPNFNKAVLNIPIKYQENTKAFGTQYLVIGIFLVYQNLGYQLTSPIQAMCSVQTSPNASELLSFTAFRFSRFRDILQAGKRQKIGNNNTLCMTCLGA